MAARRRNEAVRVWWNVASDRHRSRGGKVPLLSGASALLIAALLIAAGTVAAVGAGFYQSNDFFCLWSGARLLLSGLSPYDPVVWSEATGGLRPGHGGLLAPSACTIRFAYPLWTAVVLVPFGALPLEIAATLWLSLGIGAAIAGTALAWRAANGPARGSGLLGALVVSSQPFWLLLVGGQLTGILLGLSGGLAWAVSRDRQVLGGLALALLLIKPQLVAVLAPLLVAWALLHGAMKMVVTYVIGSLVLIGIAFVLQPGWLEDWLPELAERAGSLAPRLATLWGFAADVFGDPAWGIPLAVAILIATWLALRGAPVRPVDAIAIGIALSLALAPHAWSYDHLLLTVPWSLALAAALRASAGRRAMLLGGVVGSASLLPWALYALAFTRGGETLSVVVPLAALGAVVLAIRTTAVSDEPVRDT